MKTRIRALLLALVLVLSMTTVAFAADAGSGSACLTVSTALRDSKIEATVYVQAAEGLTNGRISVAYDPKAAILEDAQVLLSCGAASVNKETAGEASLAWVGSQLTGEETAVLRLTFRFAAAEDVTITATAPEAYAGDEAVEVAAGSATEVYNPFTDIGGHWAEEDILKAYHAGLFRGMTETTFGPQAKLNRAMFVTVLYRMAGSPAVENTETQFTDVAEDRYYTDAVAWAVETGVTNGVSETLFAPGKLLDRQEAATMLYRFAEVTGRDVTGRADLSKFSDAAKVAGWAEDAMSWAVAEGLLNGYPNGQLVPKGNATRAEAAAILARYAGL